MNNLFNMNNLAFIILLVSLILFLVFIWKRLRKHTLKIIGVMLITSIAIYSNSFWNYFLSILIIATLVTELEFLQNIAGIIRNSESYFKYLESLPTSTNEEIEEKLEQENNEIEQAINIEGNVSSENKPKERMTSNLSPVQFGMLVEEYTFKFLENKYSGNIKRYVKTHDSFDGILLSNSGNAFVEIKTSIRGYVPLSIVKRSLLKSVNEAISLKSHNKHYYNFGVKLILVGNHDRNYYKKLNDILKELNGNINVSVDLYTFTDIGLEEIL